VRRALEERPERLKRDLTSSPDTKYYWVVKKGMGEGDTFSFFWEMGCLNRSKR